MNKIKCEKCRSVIAESTCEQFAIDGLIKCEACGMTYRHLHSEKIFDRTPDCAAELTTLRERVKELEVIGKSAHELEMFLAENSGTTADWPCDIVCDNEESSNELSRLLTELTNALKPFRDQLGKV